LPDTWGSRGSGRFWTSTAPDRATLARNAIAHARGRGWIDGDARISLIGDAPSDIAAARANGAQAIAVHTGISTREELAALGPDVLLEDLRGLRVGMLV
jgi:phosphoglycolate phosphatase-like HAD superfamily hydrolase